MRKTTIIKTAIVVAGIVGAVSAHAVVKSADCTKRWNYWRVQYASW